MEIVLDTGNPLAQILFKEILQFTRKLNTSGTTADDNHVQKTLDFFLGLVLEAGGFDTVHDSFANFLGVADFLQEAGVFADAGNSF